MKGVRFRLDIPQGIILSVTYNDVIIQSIVGDSITTGVEIMFSDCVSEAELIDLFQVQMMNTSYEPYNITYEPHNEGGLGAYSCEPGSILYQCCPAVLEVYGGCSMMGFCGYCEFIVPNENHSWGAIKAIYK